MERQYLVGAFAARCGVSIRTLHHYDRVGLVRPAARTEAGYRLYTERDLLRLQQVLTLRYLGLPLARIHELLERPDFDLIASLRIQRRALRARATELDRLAAALDALLERRLASGRWSWELAADVAAAAQQGFAQKGRTMQEYYTPEQLRQFAELSEQVPDEERRAVEEGWTALLAEVRANRDLDPASPAAQALAERWDRLTEATVQGFRGNQALLDAIADNYRQGRFEGFEGAPQSADLAFIEAVKQARPRNPAGGLDN